METVTETTAYISTGTVQAFVIRHQPWFMQHFGWAQYDSQKPILTESIRAQGQAVVDRMNSGELSDEAAKVELGKICW